MYKIKILKNPVLIGNLAYFTARAILKTLKIKKEFHSNYDPNVPCLFAFWHGKQFLPILELHNHNTKKAALVSPSRDGEILENILKKLDYQVERGSSRDNNVKSLVKMIKLLKNNYTIGFGIDGPIGPIYKVKPGMTYMAQKCGVPIIPLGSAYSKKWIFEKAWDKFELPKPFAKAVYYVGEPFFIDKNANLEQCNKILEEKINLAEKKALELLTIT